MAVIQVTQNQRSEVVNVNRDVMVTVDLVGGGGFHVYAYIPQRQIDFKIVAGTSKTFAVFKGETVEAESMGTGTIIIATQNV